MITQVLDESRDNEFERNRLIREDREAREVEQQQQLQLAQFAMFQRFLATQAEMAQSTSDSSNDTWQDVMPPPSSMEGGSNNGSTVNQPARIFPESLTNQSTSRSMNPTMEPPPSTAESVSISRSLQRQVATMEQTMTHGMDELVDNVSQVTNPIDTSSDASITSSTTPTGWKTGLSRSYRHKLHGLPFDQHDELCEKIDKMAKNITTTGDVVSYAMFLIDRRIDYIKNMEGEKFERMTAESLSLNDNISIKSELETVPENDSIKSKPSPKIKSPVIIESIPSSKASPILVKTVHSDDASEVSLLRDNLMAQQAEQSRINQAILKSMEDLGKGSTKINDTGANMMTKMVVAQKSDTFPPLPTVCTDTTMGEWRDSTHSVLSATPWDIDGVSIVDMRGVIAADATTHFRARSTKLNMIMRQLLLDAKLTDSIKSLKATIETNDGVLLMESIFEHLLPLATT